MPEDDCGEPKIVSGIFRTDMVEFQDVSLNCQLTYVNYELPVNIKIYNSGVHLSCSFQHQWILHCYHGHADQVRQL